MERKIILLIIILLLVPIAAIAAHYTVNGDGTVTDNVTGLMWQQEDDDTDRDWKSAITYCEGLNVPPSTYGDWRLPNIKELSSLVDSTQYNPAIDITTFPNTNSSGYWSSTTSARYPTHAWYVNFSSDGVYIINKTNYNHYVRCVRGGQ